MGFYLRATVTYNDGEGEGKTRVGDVCAHGAGDAMQPNATPVFADDQDPDTSGDQSDTAHAGGRGEHARGYERRRFRLQADGCWTPTILTYTLERHRCEDDLRHRLRPPGQIKTKAALDF